MSGGKLTLDSDTIVAIATPPGRGAIALVRLSGPDAARIASLHIDPWPLEDRSTTLCAVRSAAGAVLDHALVTMFEAPRTYTGEPLVEISTHGGSVTPAVVLEELVRSGARPALPGEFTRRAVLGGRLDLVQAEAVTDLVDAGSRHAQQAALRQLDGGLSRRIESLRSSLLGIEALLAYDIDFPDEDDGPVPRERIEAAVSATLAEVEALLATAPRGELVRAGAVIVIAGAPNVGKSSLFNALLGRARAIVTDVPGTTRDALEAVIDGGRWPLRLVDTAGMRETTDVVERLGVELSEKHVEGAQVVLACGDSNVSLDLVLAKVASLGTPAAIVPVRTKADLVSQGDDIHAAALRVSAQTGAGLAELIARIERELEARFAESPDMPVVTAERHRTCLTRARNELAEFSGAWTAGALPATVAAVHLRSAVGALEELIGSVDVEDVLDRVFSGFCIGK